ncbi:MAG: DUF5714 domain-containing protein [Methanocorpusculum sp.]|nr:DUF5714 domain-containing protein [Methanocorpusculum sp.]
MNSENNTCIICGEPVVHRHDSRELKCDLCGKTENAEYFCIDNHYVCNDCFANPGAAVIRHVCLTTKSRNPLQIALMMMNSPAVFMHSADHHSIVAGALLAAYKNSGGEIDLVPAVDEAIKRGSAVPYGVCANTGTSGAAMSAGIFYSIVAKTNPFSVEEWGEGNLLVSRCLATIGKIGGPRCCKRCTYHAIETAVEYARENLNVSMELPEKIKCSYVPKNPECIKQRCPYYPQK